MRKIVALGYTARVGKDFTFQELKKKLPVHRVAFADALKTELNTWFRFLGIDFHKLDKKPRLKKLLRPVMVWYGCMKRKKDPDYWVKKALSNLPDNKITVITDLRFENECQALQKLGALIVEIDAGTPPINETEAINSVLCKKYTELLVYNNMRDTVHVDQILKAVNS